MAIFIEDNCLFVNGNVVLTGVPRNIVISTAPSGSAFLGANSLTPSSRHVFTLGTFQGFNFLSFFRFKIWWMTPKIGTSGSDVRIETQLLLIEAEEKFVLIDNDKLSTDHFYILVLPVLEGAFRASLQGTETNELQFCVESGDSDVQTTQVFESVFINSGDNPYELIRNSVKILAAHKGTFSHLDDKKLPVHLDWFGWCTWDAFYKDVNPEGIRQGFESLSQGGYAPRFLVLDEGWQDTFNEFQNEDESTDFGFETRLKDFKENDKFRNLSSDEYTTLAEFIKFLKERYDLKYVYVWHAILGCWGGVLPSSEALEKYRPELDYPIQSPGNLGNLRDIAMDGIEKYGMGVINPEMISDFYSDYHSYIASIGVDGVKVDIQNVLETIGSGYGGRVRMTAMYQRGLEESVARNFENNNLICSMSHDSDLLFSSKKSAVIRSYEDFMPREQLLQTVHIAAVSFNCLFLGELGVADWDMFQSLHYAADFHAASRAVGGCAVYVSDKPGNHDFNILKRLVLPDGSIMRARYAGRPTRDCLFKDPVMDGKTLLKIWNLNKLSGIVGVFNCQGGGAWPWVNNLEDNSTPEIISSKVSPKDVEFLEDVAGDSWQGDCVVYAFYSGSLNKISKSGHLEVSLRILKCELFTVCPVRVFNEAVHFAPIGLLDMYNSGGAVETLTSEVGPDGCIVKMKVRGCGRFGAYISQTPRVYILDRRGEVSRKENTTVYVTSQPWSSSLKMVVCLSVARLCSLKNVVISPAPSESAFLGASSLTPSSRLVFSLGVLQGFKFLSLFRFKIWWMMPKNGTSASELRPETQLLLLEVKEDSGLQSGGSEPSFYILVLPVLEGAFRASLQGTQTNELQFCVESGDPDVQISQVSESVFLNSGENPYELIKDSIKILAEHKGTFKHVDDKKMPAHLDWFGWCTWDAFYRDVNPEGIRQGFESLSEAGYAPRFLVIDDGWQDIYNEFQNEGEEHSDGSDFGFATRLSDIKENEKFRHLSSDEYTKLPEFINFLKHKYGLKYVYVWHAILGCWGGVLPSSEALRKYNPKLVYPVQSPGNIANVRDIAMDSIEKYGMGVIDPEKIGEFYNDYHGYLANNGVDGVKVDILNVLETIGSGYGGRVRMISMYVKGLEEAVSRNFGNNNLICSMCHITDTLFSSRRSAFARAYEDFMPREPTFQTVHIAGVSFNSLILGELVVPDWDMFQSLHYAADFHASSRAIGGCAVYVSDVPGNHDFEILKKLVLPDGSILRARYAGRPTRDCLFIDPVMDGESLLKIWNLNMLSGVIGVFNCQGVGTWPFTDTPLNTQIPEVLSREVSPKDVEFLEEVAGDKWQGDCAVYAFNSGSLTIVPKTGKVNVSLGILKCELYTVSPVRVIDDAVSFAPIGLLDMYNSGGAVDALDSKTGPDGFTLTIRTRGYGRFGAYSSTKPRYCTVDTKKEEFTYGPEDGLLVIKLEGACQNKDIECVY